ncbi:MAG: hypothetical protein AAFS10_24520, partial [Myxococcota bacterium]
AVGSMRITSSSGVTLTGNRGFGMYSSASVIETMTHLLIRDTYEAETEVPSPLGPQQVSTARGLGVLEQSNVTLQWALIEGSEGSGISVEGNAPSAGQELGEPSRLTLLDAIVRQTRVSRSEPGTGVLVIQNGKATLERVVLDENLGAGLVAGLPGTEVTLRDTLVTHTQPTTADDPNVGILVQDGGSLTAERLVVFNTPSTGIFMEGAGTQAELRDLVVAATFPDNRSGSYGPGLFIAQDAEATLERVTLWRNVGVGAIVFNAKVTAQDLVIAHTQDDRSIYAKAGLGIVQNSEGNNYTVTLERVLLEANFEFGALLSNRNENDTSTPATPPTLLRDLTVRNTRSNVYGRGLEALAPFILERAAFADNHSEAIMVSGPYTTAALTDLIIARTQPSPSLTGGLGLTVTDNAQLSVSRALLEDNTHTGALIEQGSATLTDISVRLTNEASRTDQIPPYGSGLSVGPGAEVELRQFYIDSNALIGLEVDEGGALEASYGTVSRNFIGLNDQRSDAQRGAPTCVTLDSNCCGMDCQELTCNDESRAIAVPEAGEVSEAVFGEVEGKRDLGGP